MALTRGSTGHSAPRKAYVPNPSSTATKTTKTKTKTSKTAKIPAAGSGAISRSKANTSKPRVKATAGGRVTKPATTENKRHSTTKDKIKGLVKRAQGKVEGKPGKKVGLYGSSFPCPLRPAHANTPAPRSFGVVVPFWTDC